MPTSAEVEAMLTGPGGAFEVETAEVWHGFGKNATAAEPRKRGFQLLTELVKHSLQT